jgi:hypothetical protein
MPNANRMIDELATIELTSDEALQVFCTKMRDLCRDFAWTLDFQAEALEAALKTVKPVDAKFGGISARVRAKAVAWCMRAAADALGHGGKQAVKCWMLFVRYYAPELGYQRKNTNVKPGFTINKVA